MITGLVWQLCLIVMGVAAETRGTIDGVVLDGTARNAPLAGAEIVLCIDDNGRRVPVAESRSDDQGRFTFENLPAGEALTFVAGANRSEVHYPGPHIRLSTQSPHASIQIVAYAAVEEPCPLEAREHSIVVRAEQGVLHISESLWIVNPGDRTFVGLSVSDMPPVTLRLSIPEDFEKVTFQKEFFGRQFQLINGRLLTSIPWTPGERRLEFTYVLPIEQRSRLLQRRLDLPTSGFQLRVLGEDVQELECNLPRHKSDQAGEVLFRSDQLLPAGHILEIQFGKLPVRFINYARWIAVALLGVLIVGAAIRLRKEHRSASVDTQAVRPFAGCAP